MTLTKDKCGKQSSTRIAMLVWTVTVLLAWLWASYTKNELIEIPQSVVYILGILVAGKGLQSFSESKPPEPQVVIPQVRPSPELIYNTPQTPAFPPLPPIPPVR